MKASPTICTLLSVFAASVNAATPLFESDDTVALTVTAPMRELIRARHRKETYDAEVSYADSAGNVVTLDARISARGNSRLETCDFPPIRLEFEPAETKGTLFEGQKRLKMVTHCKRGKDGERWVLQELGIYRAYNVVTDYSYRVRRLDMTWRDAASQRWEREGPAFFIEDTDDLAARVGRQNIRPPEVQTEQYHLAETTHHILFQYLIANTDFSVKRGPQGEGCCHNARVIAEPGSQANWIVVPYDFDQAGIINTSYALPGRRLGIRRVTQRLYRGFCWQNDALADSIARFNERRDAITAALVPAEISASQQSRIRRFVDRFYDTINDPAELSEAFFAKCRGGATVTIRKTRTAGE